MSTQPKSTVSILNEAQKDAVVHYYVTGGKTVTQTWIAKHFGVHRRTIYTVLKERGALLTKEESTRLVGIAQVMKELDLTPEKIRQLAQAPALTPQAIVSHLVKLDGPNLTQFLYDVIGAHYLQDVMAREVLHDAA